MTFSSVPSGISPAARQAAVLIFLASAGFAVFSDAIGFSFQLNWDDGWYVTGNERVQGLTPAHVARAFDEIYLWNYAPVHLISYMIDFELTPSNERSPLNPFVFHLTNLLLHIANAWLVFRLAGVTGLPRCAAALAGTIFLVHPLQVESVAWISERKNVLFVFFSLMSWLAYSRFCRTGGFGSYAWALASFAMALLSKSHAVVLPVILVLHDRVFHPEPAHGGSSLRRTGPFFAMALAAGILSASLQWGGEGETYFARDPLTIALTMPYLFARYMLFLIFPSGLSAFYHVPAVSSVWDARWAVSMAVCAGYAAVAARLTARKRPAGFWMWVYALGLAPVLHVIPMSTPMNDRYVYLSMAGAAIGFAAVVAPVSSAPGAWRMVRWAAAIALTAVLAAVAAHRVQVWENGLTLWSDAAIKAPASGLVRQKYGESLFMSGRYEESIRAFDLAESLRGVKPATLIYRGRSARAAGDHARALEDFQKLSEMSGYEGIAKTEISLTRLQSPGD